MKISKMLKESFSLMSKMSDTCLEKFLTYVLPMMLRNSKDHPVHMVMVNDYSCSVFNTADDANTIDGIVAMRLVRSEHSEFYIFDAKHGAVIPVVGDKPMGGSILHILKTIEETSEKHLPETITAMNGSKPKNTSPLEDLSSEQLEKAFKFLELMERMLQHD